MDEEFVKKVLSQALAGEKTPVNATELWNCYKRFTKEFQPALFAMVERDEYLSKKQFLIAIDMFASVPSFLFDKGVNLAIAAKVTGGLHRDISNEISRMNNEEKKSKP